MSTLSTPTFLPPLVQPCSRCYLPFASGEMHMVVDGTSWHNECFKCAQCFSLLHDKVYFSFEGRLYCQHDFQVLYAPVCVKCGNFVFGTVRRALNGSFHPECFLCEECGDRLDDGVWFIDGRSLCTPCKDDTPRETSYRCLKCKQRILPDELLRYKSDFYHAYHFSCKECKEMLNSGARQLGEDLFCQRCFDLRCEICPGCKRPVDPQHERSIYAVKKHWHIEHFCCFACGDPFRGREHFEWRDKVYCRKDFVQLKGDYCFECGRGITGERIDVFSKSWCPNCYRCVTCQTKIGVKEQVAELDMRPMCKRCFKNKTYQKVLKLQEKGGR